ncbi:MAG: hypothetical protein HOP19_16585 [Acidobacteria bacterium]|nr:hypothetical protein [Acidobacteriota bacterium]
MTYTNSKIRLLLGLCCFVIASLAARAQTPSATMSKDDRAQLLKRFDNATKQTLAAVKKLSVAQCAYESCAQQVVGW